MNTSKSEIILLVDDRPATRYSTSRVLKHAGFEVIEATTGTEALRIITPDFGLVVLDVNLPDLDGHEVCRRIRQRADVSRIPVIHLSATFVSDDHKIKGLEAGADGYLTHPVDPLVLIATVKAFLRAREMESELVRSEAKFRAVFDQALTGICLISDDMIYLDVNPAFCKILGRESSEVIGKHFSSFLPVGTENIVATISQFVERTGAWCGVMPFLRSDSQLIQLEWNVSIHSDPGIRLAMVSDITERQRIQAERQQLLDSERAARAAAEKANRLKDEFLATLSHELRTPLNAIVGWAEVLRFKPPTEAVLAEGLATIERNAKEQSELINDLLDVSRIISGKLRLKIESVDPRTIVRHALAAVVPAAIAQGVRIDELLPETCAPVWCDPSRLQQILWNLINNAVKFTPQGGRVSIELNQNDDRLRIVVTDTGKGIKPEFLDHLFERFRQEDASTTRTYGGLGLGLAIVRHLVELHGGTVTANSEGEGRGSQFVVQLPQRSLEEHAATRADDDLVADRPVQQRDRRQADLLGIQILIVDDDQDTRHLAARVLRENNAQVEEAHSVVEALDKLATCRPHVLVSDIGMPDYDGYDLIREVRRLGYSSEQLPAIAITAFARSEDRDKALAEGYQFHLSKPISPIELVSMIGALFDRQNL